MTTRNWTFSLGEGDETGLKLQTEQLGDRPADAGDPNGFAVALADRIAGVSR
jgi:hypothetical protein